MLKAAYHFAPGFFFLLLSFSETFAQSKWIDTDSLLLAGVQVNGVALQRNNKPYDNNKAKDILEYESGYNSILQTEILKLSHISRNRSAGISLEKILIDKLKGSGWIVERLEWDPSYYRLEKLDETLVMHVTQKKKSADLFFGKTDSRYNDPVDINEIFGDWGNISQADLLPDRNIVITKEKQLPLTNNPNYSVQYSGISLNKNGTFKRMRIYRSGKIEANPEITEGTFSLIGRHITLTIKNRYKTNTANYGFFDKTESYWWTIRQNNETGRPCLILFFCSWQNSIINLPVGYCK
jgi:hypothetical protein